MPDLTFPILSIAVLAPAAAAFAIAQSASSSARRIASASVAVSLLASTMAAGVVFAGNGLRHAEIPGLFAADGLNVVLMVVFSAIGLATLAAAPRRDMTQQPASGMLILISATLACYAADSLLMLLLGWGLTAIPWMRSRNISKYALLAATGALLIAIGLLCGPDNWDLLLTPFHELGVAGGVSTAARCAFGFLILAAFLRMGIFPAHGWVLHEFDRGALLPAALLLNGHLGAFLVARVVIPVFPEISHEMLPVLGDIALLAAMITTIMGIAERKPRRLLALLLMTQSAFIFSGLQSKNIEGITGSLVQWLVVAVAGTGLVCVYRALEARVSSVASGPLFAGLGARTPRLATFFALSGLALVGMPGTLGFCAEDLLFHGALETHPQLGIAMLVATALAAIQIYRLFASLFLGERATLVPEVPDALPRERWALAACAVFLVAGGLFPANVISWRTSAAHAIASKVIVSKPNGTHPSGAVSTANAVASGGYRSLAAK